MNIDIHVMSRNEVATGSPEHNGAVIRTFDHGFCIRRRRVDGSLPNRYDPRRACVLSSVFVDVLDALTSEGAV